VNRLGLNSTISIYCGFVVQLVNVKVWYLL